MARDRDRKDVDVAKELESWEPKTEIGRQVKSGEVKDINEVLSHGRKILEPQVVDLLIPGLETDLILVGQSKGKFGGGKRSAFKQTQKVTREGNKMTFKSMAIVGNRNGIVGLGEGTSKEKIPARDKALRNAKLNLIRVVRGAGSWESNSEDPHSIPFKVTGKEGSVEVTLMPAPVGAGIVAEKELAKILELAGIKDVWVQTKGHTKTKTNTAKACFNALSKLVQYYYTNEDVKNLKMDEQIA